MEKNNENRIIVEHVYKTFNVYLDKANSLKEKLLFWKRNRKETREVLKDVNLTIKNGEAVALIGVNGSGKSTLLKLMTKIIYPTKGKITVDGTEIEITYINRKKLRDIQLIKVDSIDSNIKLEGAKFRLNKLEENGDIDENFTAIEVTTNQNGQAFFNNLPYGKYIITEIEAPEGYELLKEPIKFEINKDSNNSIITIEVKNNKSIKLPIAGGNGNITIKYIGFMLIGLAVILYSFVIIRNKKYKFN